MKGRDKCSKNSEGHPAQQIRTAGRDSNITRLAIKCATSVCSCCHSTTQTLIEILTIFVKASGKVNTSFQKEHP